MKKYLPAVIPTLKYWTWRQNNTGGSFVRNAEVAELVIVEAITPGEAEEKAASVGIYYNGCDDGMDCPCCGDRWYPADEEGTEVPEYYGTPIVEFDSVRDKSHDVILHTREGEIFYGKS